MPTTYTVLASTLALGALLAGGTQALAYGHAPAPAPEPGPGRILERTLPGPAALRTLGAHGLQRAAAANDMAATRLEDLLEDRTTRLSPDGRLFYADVLTADGTGTAAGTEVRTSAEAPLDQTFSLHSRPGSSRTIFLDFDGATVSGTWWNDPLRGGLPSTDVAAFSLDADHSTFDDVERRRIQDVWARVAEDYVPFDVDVTTEQPAPDKLTRSSSSDLTFGTHVLFAPDRTVADPLCGGRCAGMAWVGAFDALGNPGPAWVFPDLTSKSGWQLAEVASHEAGHTLWLLHHGTTSSEYYDGRSPWGPIMGSSDHALTQFSNGDYSGANNQKQYDLATISKAGAPELADDHGDTPAATTSTLGASATGAAGGVIGNRHDQDVLRYDHGACLVTVTVRTAKTGPNLDARLRVLTATGKVLGKANPTVKQTAVGVVTGTGAVLSLPARPAGALYVEVDGVGQGAMPSSGYSDYGSVGHYTVTVSGCAAVGSGGAAEEPATPGRARIRKAYSGARGGKVTAKATWAAPLSDGGAPITGYRVTALKVSAGGAVLKRTTSLRPASSRAWRARLTRGYHRFTVVAVNAAGPGTRSARSNRVRAR